MKMQSEARRSVAYIAARLIRRRQGSPIYDYSGTGYTHFSGTVGNNVAIYDHSASAHISGSLKQFYHHGLRAQISLPISGKNFSGYDCGSSTHFSGSASQSNVTLYDYGESKRFQYFLSRSASWFS
jgi:hypothetical protein